MHCVYALELEAAKLKAAACRKRHSTSYVQRCAYMPLQETKQSHVEPHEHTAVEWGRANTHAHGDAADREEISMDH
jgi:hypothetical protein